jgi:AcrR family transcriptional regulator
VAFTDEQNEMIRRDLIREARRCGVAVGMRKTSVEQLTEAVGISKGSFYKFFASKELLFFAVLEDIHAECFAAAQKSLQENTPLQPHECKRKTGFRKISREIHPCFLPNARQRRSWLPAVGLRRRKHLYSSRMTRIFSCTGCRRK